MSLNQFTCITAHTTLSITEMLLIIYFTVNIPSNRNMTGLSETSQVFYAALYQTKVFNASCFILSFVLDEITEPPHNETETNTVTTQTHT